METLLEAVLWKPEERVISILRDTIACTLGSRFLPKRIVDEPGFTRLDPLRFRGCGSLSTDGGVYLL
jgi:hypothetical protein